MVILANLGLRAFISRHQQVGESCVLIFIEAGPTFDLPMQQKLVSILGLRCLNRWMHIWIAHHNICHSKGSQIRKNLRAKPGMAIGLQWTWQKWVRIGLGHLIFEWTMRWWGGGRAIGIIGLGWVVRPKTNMMGVGHQCGCWHVVVEWMDCWTFVTIYPNGVLLKQHRWGVSSMQNMRLQQRMPLWHGLPKRGHTL